MKKAVSDFKKANPNVKVKTVMEFNFNGNSKRPIEIYKNGTLDDILSDNYKNP